MSTKLIRSTGLAAAIALSASCGDVIRSSQSPVILAVNTLTAGGSSTLLSDVLTNGNVFHDLGSATLTVIMKNTTVAPTTNNRVTINRYRVQYSRADGHNTPGVDVPYSFDGVATLAIPAGGTGSLGFELVRHTAKLESPLIQLRSNPNVITMIAEVTFFGEDLVGNDVSATGAMLINFAEIADAVEEEAP
jgi:hypothetical protein